MTDIAHTFFHGVTTSGKTYMAYWMAEQGVMSGKIKFCDVWRTDLARLEEFLTLAYPAEVNSKNYKLYTKFKPVDWIEQTEIHLYVPICEGMTKSNETNPFPLQFPNDDRIKTIPFTVPCDDLTEGAVQILYGSSDADAAYQKYGDITYKGITFPQLMKRLSSSRFEKINLKARGLGGQIGAVKFSGSGSYATTTALLEKLNAFTNEGILGDSKMSTSLPAIFKRNKEWQNQKAVVGLYVGHIKDMRLRIFALISFITYMARFTDLVKNKVDFKNVVYLNELSVLAPKQSLKSYRDVHHAITAFMTNWVPQARHSNIEIHADTQSVHSVDPLILSQFKRQYLTRYSVSDTKALELFSTIFDIEAKSLKNVWAYWDKTNKYRFLLAGAYPQTYREPSGRMTIGFELPRPKLSFDGKVDFGEFELHDFTEYWHDYRAIVGTQFEELRTQIKEEITKAKEKKKKDSMTQQEAATQAMKVLGYDKMEIDNISKKQRDELTMQVKDKAEEIYGDMVSIPSTKRALGIWK